jgi:hypothetical protein
MEVRKFRVIDMQGSQFRQRAGDRPELTQRRKEFLSRPGNETADDSSDSACRVSTDAGERNR